MPQQDDIPVYLFDNALVERQTLILGWHTLWLCEGRGASRKTTPFEDSGHATQTSITRKLKFDAPLVREDFCNLMDLG